MQSKESYKQIIKSTSLFGGVQVIQILATLIRGKLVAIFLGTAGVGINTLYNSVVAIIVQLSSLGLNFSAVRDISQASEIHDNRIQARIITIFKRWMYFCCILGAILMCTGSKWISKLTFGNYNSTTAFVLLSLAVVLTIATSSNITILQGTRRLKDMAKASVIGSILSLLLCIPFYYYYQENGIIQALITSAFSTFVVSWFFSKKINVTKTFISVADTIKSGVEMSKLGVAMMSATLIGSAVNYLINAYVSNYGSLSDVGLFGSGISITNQYVGLVFNAMAIDYFPRLSAVSSDKHKVNEMANQQAEIVLLIICPLLIAMMLTAPLLIRILLSTNFLKLTDFVCWSAYAMLFKSAAFALGYISFAKGDKKTFFLFEGVFNSSIILISNVVGYHLGGIDGIAIAILISNIIYLFNINFLVSRFYQFRLSRSLIQIFIFSTVILTIALIISVNYSNLYGYLLGMCLFICCMMNSYKELDKRIQLKLFLSYRIKKKQAF